MYKTIKHAMSMILIMSLSLGLGVKAIAGNQTLPASNLNIIALELIETENVLRLYIRRRIKIGNPERLSLNPANCSSTTRLLNTFGAGDSLVHYFDIALGASNRSAVEQRQLIAQAFAAFLTSSEVRVLLRDDACSSVNGRLVSGLGVGL